MVRPRKSDKSTKKPPKHLHELHKIDTTKHLVKAWEKLCISLDENSSTSPAPVVPDSHFYDSRIGLGLIPRVLLIRAVMRTMFCLGLEKAPDSAGWQMCLRPEARHLELISGKALRQAAAGTLPKKLLSALCDPIWREQLCNGNGRDDERKIAGFNGWFASRYAEVFDGGRITPEELFNLPFFGADALERYVYLLCTGRFSPGVNRSLVPAHLRALRPTGDDAPSVARIIARGDNQGRSIVPVVCTHHPSAATVFAVQLLDEVKKRGYSACYIPLKKYLADGRLQDADFRSILWAIYRFVKGDLDLSHGREASSSVSVADQILAIRLH
jgi:hypothetical protein